jgi:hypothetical protein
LIPASPAAKRNPGCVETAGMTDGSFDESVATGY